jgi:hypothetical protein
VAVSEESCGPHQAVFTVRLSKRLLSLPPQVVTVQYATADGTAVGGVDYAPVSGTLTFTPPSHVLTVVAPITDALVPGPDKAFTLHLSNPTGAVLVKAIGTATLHAPTVAKCASCGLSCNDGDACTHDLCDATAGCKAIDENRCATPVVLLGACGVDSDGDGLSDAWEGAQAIDSNCDGVIDAENDQALPDADAARPDIYLLYDAMLLPDDGGDCTVAPIPGYPNHSPDCAVDQYCLSGTCRGHSDVPDPGSLQDVVDAFAAHDISLHLEARDAVPHSRVVSFGAPVDACTADSASLPGTRRAIDFYALKAAGFDPKRRPAYHYAVFGHFNTCDSVADCAQPACALPDSGLLPLFGETGLSEQPGNDLIVSFGRIRDRALPLTLVNQGATLMHELGHNLALDHGGPLGWPGAAVNYKPNYLSVMSYSFQSTGISTADAPGSTVPASTRLDYSNAALASLDESALNEPAGIGSGDNDITRYFCPESTPAAGTGPIDWNCNDDGGAETGVATEINNDGATQILVGYADWPNLLFAFQGSSQYNDGPPAGFGRTQRELDVETELRQHLLYPVRPVRTRVLAEGREISVAILGGADLDVREIETSSLRVAGAAPGRAVLADVDGDGWTDLVAVVDRSALELPGGAKSGSLTGWLRDSQSLVGAFTSLR